MRKPKGRRFVDCNGLQFDPDTGRLLKEQKNAIKNAPQYSVIIHNTIRQQAYKITKAVGYTAIHATQTMLAKTGELVHTILTMFCCCLETVLR